MLDLTLFKNLQSIVVGKGPRGTDFEFKFTSRKDPAMVGALSHVHTRLSAHSCPLLITDLGQALSNKVNIVPAGMVVFFPSYAFLDVP